MELGGLPIRVKVRSKSSRLETCPTFLWSWGSIVKSKSATIFVPSILKEANERMVEQAFGGSSYYIKYCISCHQFYLSLSILIVNHLSCSVTNTKCQPHVICHSLVKWFWHYIIFLQCCNYITYQVACSFKNQSFMKILYYRHVQMQIIPNFCFEIWHFDELKVSWDDNTCDTRSVTRKVTTTVTLNTVWH
jgi:hypothetical protein